MKKIFTYLVVALALTSVSVWAKAKYNVEGAPYSYNQGVFTFNTDYVLNDFAVTFYSKSNFQLDMSNLLEIGYYTIDNNGNVGARVSVPLGKSTDDSAASNTSTFKEGDKIGIYVKIKGQLTGTNDNNFDWKYDREHIYTSTKDAFTDADKDVIKFNAVDNIGDPQYFSIYIDNHSTNQPHYQYAFGGEAINGGGGNGGGSTGGQPLPGLLMTLTLGGMAVAGMSRKRKNSKA